MVPMTMVLISLSPVSVVAGEATETVERPVPAAAPVRGRRPWRAHLVVALVALALAVYVTQGLWSGPARHVLVADVADQAWFEWLLGYGVHLLGHGTDPFYTWLMNAPLGVNLAANTSVTVYAVLFAPLTFLAGPAVSYVAILTLNLAGAAFAWYLFLLKFLVKRPVAAALGGLFCGFAPGFVSHANGHLNWTAGWVAPLVLWGVLRLRTPGRWLRNGALLGVLVAVCFSIAAEGLFFTAIASAIFLAAWSLHPATRAEARAALPTMLAGLGVTAVVAFALLAYPLYMHFAGPQSFTGTGYNQRYYAEDLAAYGQYPTRSVAGWLGLGSDLAPNPVEETSFFGVPLLVLVVIALGALWRRAAPGRRATLLAVSAVGVVFLVLSWGPKANINSVETDFTLPYAFLQRLPLFDSALPSRFALVTVGVFGIVLALTADRLLTHPLPSVRAHTTWAAAYAVALVPLFPLPLLVSVRSAEPAFISEGLWKDYVADGGVITTLPTASNAAPDGQRWQAYTMARGGAQFRIPGGYFLGPGGRDGTGRTGSVPRPTDSLFVRAATTGLVPTITAGDRDRARADLAYWNVTAVFLPSELSGGDGPLFRAAVEMTAIDLLGPPETVGDVLLWRIRPGVDPVRTARR